MKALEFLDDNKKPIPLIAQELQNNKTERGRETEIKLNVIESLFEFMDELFDSVFMKTYHENVKKNK